MEIRRSRTRLHGNGRRVLKAFVFAAALLIPIEAAAIAVKYKVIVETGTLPNAGTDAVVKITMKGPGGTAAFDQVLNKKGRDDFEKGSKDAFVIQASLDAGPITSVHVSRGTQGEHHDWQLVGIKVHYYFPDGPHPLFPVMEDELGKANVSEFVFGKEAWVPSGSAGVDLTMDASKVKEMIVDMTGLTESVLMYKFGSFDSNFTSGSITGSVSVNQTISNQVLFNSNEGAVTGIAACSYAVATLGPIRACAIFVAAVRTAVEGTKGAQGTEATSVSATKTYDIPSGCVSATDICITQVKALGYLKYNDYATSKAHQFAFATPKKNDVLVMTTAFKVVETKKEGGKNIRYVEPVADPAYITDLMIDTLKRNDCKLLGVDEKAAVALPGVGKVMDQKTLSKKVKTSPAGRLPAAVKKASPKNTK
jgi:hypothetical protein